MPSEALQKYSAKETRAGSEVKVEMASGWGGETGGEGTDSSALQTLWLLRARKVLEQLIMVCFG